MASWSCAAAVPPADLPPPIVSPTVTDGQGGDPPARRDATRDATGAIGDSVDADGWTVFTASADTRTVYVSRSAGDDRNDGLSPSGAKRTLAAGGALLRPGFPDWLLLQRGDVWQESLGQWVKSGRSPKEPMLVSTFGNESARPRLETGAEGGISTAPGGGSPPSIDNLAIVGLHFVAHTYSGAGECVGAQMLQPSSHVLFEDCMFEGYGTNLVFQAYSPSGTVRHTDFVLRRSTIVDAHTVHGSGPHPQGLYASGVDGLLVEECLFDHNGWSETVSGAGADIFSHNLYIDNGNTAVVVRGNIIANAASHGLQLRCGGAVLDNLFVRNSIALLVGGGNDPEPAGVTADVRGNAILDGKDIDEENPRGWGMCFANIASGRVAHNLVANNAQGGYPVAIALQGDQAGDDRASIGVHDLSLERNIVFDWRGSIVVEGRSANLSNIDFRNNDIQEHESSAALIEHVDAASVARVRWSGNRFFSRRVPPGAWMRIGEAETTRAPSSSEAEDSTLPVPASYPDSERGLASYSILLGISQSSEGFLTRARAQARGNWRPELTAVAITRYLREGFDLERE